MDSKTCSIDGCAKPHVARGWCSNHYKKWQLYGDPLGHGTKHAPRGEGCVNVEGYLVRTAKGRQQKDHRMVMEQILDRPLLPDEIVHHVDGNKLNNDPGNLQVMTQSEHTALHRDMEERATHCGKGHPWTEENTYIRKDTGQRMCKSCHRERELQRYHRKQAQVLS